MSNEKRIYNFNCRSGLFVIGIILATVFGIEMATSLLNTVFNENIILSDVSLAPSSTINRTMQITNIEKPISIAMHMESERNGQIRQPSNVSIVQEIISPTGQIVNKNEFTSRNEEGLFTTYRPSTSGNYTVRISNMGQEEIRVGGMFGYLPIMDENNKFNLQPIFGIIAGAIMSIIGILTLIVGGIIAFLDRREKKPL